MHVVVLGEKWVLKEFTCFCEIRRSSFQRLRVRTIVSHCVLLHPSEEPVEKLTRILVALSAFPVANVIADILELVGGTVQQARLWVPVTVTR